MHQVKLQGILNSLQSCYKISVKNEYEEIQEDLLSVIVDFKNILNSGIELKEGDEMIEYKDSKDRTKFNIVFKLNEESLNNLPKSRIPEKVFEYLIKNNLFKESHFHFFLKNNFRTTFAKKTGDLIFHYEQTDITKRYNKFVVNNKTYFACNQWERPSIDKFNEYVNKEFSDSIKISPVE